MNDKLNEVILMFENIFSIILDSPDKVVFLILPMTLLSTAIRFLFNLLSEGSSYGIFDYLSDAISSLLDIIKSAFSKPEEKTSIDSCSEWDNGFFNNDVYNSKTMKK